MHLLSNRAPELFPVALALAVSMLFSGWSNAQSTATDMENAADPFAVISENEASTQASLPQSTPLTVGQSDSARYGHSFDGTFTSMEGASFTFERTSEPLNLTVTGFDIDTVRELTVYVNNTLIGALSQTPNNSTGQTTLAITIDVMINGINTLEFRQSRSGNRWGITDILLNPDLTQPTNLLSVGLSDPSRYGQSFNGVSTGREGVTFSFEDIGDVLTLTVTGFDIDTTSELRIYVNDTLIGAMSTTPNNGSGLTTLPINRDVQITGINTLEFRQLHPGRRWGITDIILTAGCNYPLVIN